MSQEEPQSIGRSAFSFFSGTALSRLSGLARDVSMAFCFGSSPVIAAFFVAFRFSNLIRRLFGEGILSSGFVPHFETLRKENPKEALGLFCSLQRSLGKNLACLICLLEIVLYSAYKSSGSSIFFLTMLMLPGIFFICLFGLNMALLQCEKYFFLSGIAPVAFNFVWICAVWLLKDQQETKAVVGLSAVIILAFFMQWLMTMPRILKILREKLSLKECFSKNVFSGKLSSLFKPLLLSVVGLSAVQVNSALDGVFAYFASEEGPAYLWYAIRLQQLPLALFGIALSSALLPPLSRSIASGDFSRFQELLRFAIKRSFSLMLPCTFGIFALGFCSINLLYGRGHFTLDATAQTTLCLWGYGIGLVPSVFSLLLAPAFYAQKDYLTPMKAALLSVVLNIILNSLFVFWFSWGAFSIALATSLAAFANCAYLALVLSKKIGPLFNPSVLLSCAKTAACGLIALVVTFFLGHFLLGDPTLALLQQKSFSLLPLFSESLLHFIALGGTFLVFFFSYAYFLRAEDILSLIPKMQSRLVPPKE